MINGLYYMVCITWFVLYALYYMVCVMYIIVRHCPNPANFCHFQAYSDKDKSTFCIGRGIRSIWKSRSRWEERNRQNTHNLKNVDLGT